MKSADDKSALRREEKGIVLGGTSSILPFQALSVNPAAKSGGVDPCPAGESTHTIVGRGGACLPSDIAIHPAITRRRAERKAESEGYRFTYNVEAVLLGLGLSRSDLRHLRGRVGDAVFENRQDLRAGRLNERTRSILRTIAKIRPRRWLSILEALLKPRQEARPMRFTKRDADWLIWSPVAVPGFLPVDVEVQTVRGEKKLVRLVKEIERTPSCVLYEFRWLNAENDPTWEDGT